MTAEEFTFWTAIVSLASAAVVTIGPPVLRKIFPPDATVAEIAKSSVASTQSSLDSTLKLLKDDLVPLRAEQKSISRKLDKILDKI